MALNGFDISRYQSDMKIANVKSDFVIVKATQGTNYTSPTFESQINEVLSLGRLAGVYHYVAGTDYKQEVNLFLNRIKKYIGKVLICVDWEKDQNSMWGSGRYITSFMDYLYSITGIKPIIYMSKSVCRESYWTTVPLNYELWVAQYANNDIVTNYKTNPWTDTKGYGKFKNPIIFQYSSKGHLSGYRNDLDLDICYLDKDGWLKRCKKEESEPIKTKKVYTITADTLNIREKADSSSNDIGDLKKGSVITVDKIENGFAHFEGWCSTKYLG